MVGRQSGYGYAFFRGLWIWCRQLALQDQFNGWLPRQHLQHAWWLHSSGPAPIAGHWRRGRYVWWCVWWILGQVELWGKCWIPGKQIKCAQWILRFCIGFLSGFKVGFAFQHLTGRVRLWFAFEYQQFWLHGWQIQCAWQILEFHVRFWSRFKDRFKCCYAVLRIGLWLLLIFEQWRIYPRWWGWFIFRELTSRVDESEFTICVWMFKVGS